MDVIAARPSEFSEGKRNLFKALVQQGGEVSNDALSKNVQTAKALVIGCVGGEVLGVAALKCPQVSYRRRIGGQAGIEISQVRYPFELGYVFLLPKAQGKKLSHQLVAGALGHAEGDAVFATTRCDNLAMLSVLKKAGFQAIGKEYDGRDMQRIQLLIRPGE